MASVTNNHNRPLGLPDGTTLNPGIATNVPKWGEVSKNAVVKVWQERGILTVSEEAVPAADEKAELRAKLEERGVQFDRRAGVEKLRELLAEAEQAGEAGEG
ncbi:hypothetical protein [Coralloluteibacterium thermophilus]|uniref:HeH/LEM domain-containing protein n=1 Tax=Coralloluteibacterium thermophilum TaxID=2707049 RepID=A0ABV9NPV6_9GAMM